MAQTALYRAISNDSGLKVPSEGITTADVRTPRKTARERGVLRRQNLWPGHQGETNDTWGPLGGDRR